MEIPFGIGTILVVDDDEIQRLLLTTSLHDKGYKTLEAGNGRQALSVLQSAAIDVLLLDLIMPEMDGFAVLTEMKLNEKLRHIPVVVISGEQDTESAIECIEMGAADYLLKPVDPVLLNARVKSSMANKRLNDVERAAQARIEAQKNLFQNLVTVARATTETLSLSATMENALRVSADLAGVTEASIYLMGVGQTRGYVYEFGEVSEPPRQFLEEVVQVGLAGWVMKEQTSAIIADTRQDSRWVTSVDPYIEPRSVLCVPIIHQARVLGALTLGHPEPAYFSSELQTLMEAAADHITLAIFNAQVYETQRIQARLKNTLYETLSALSRDLEPDILLGEAVREFAIHTDWPTIAIFLIEPKSSLLALAATAGSEALAAGTTVSPESPLARLIQTGEACLIQDISLEPNQTTADLFTSGSALLAPMTHADTPYGILVAANAETHMFDEDGLVLAQSLAGVIALALNNAYSRAAVRVSEMQYRDLFENAFDLIQGVGPAGEFMYVNRRWLEVMAYEEAEIIGRPFSDVIAPDELDHCLRVFAQLHSGETVSRIETKFVTKKGRQIYVEGSISSRYEDGRLTRTRGIFRDITERKQAEDALMSNFIKTGALYDVAQAAIMERELRPLLISITEAVATSLPADRVALIVLDQDTDEVAHFVTSGSGAKRIRHPDRAEMTEGLTHWVLDNMRAALSPGDRPDPRESELLQQRRRDADCGAIIVAPMLYRGRTLGTITAINRPEERQFDQEDVDMMMALAGQSAITIENAHLYEVEKRRVLELQAYNEELDTFASTVAHDLKHPITSIIGYAELINRMTAPTQQQQELLARITESGYKMATIIQELLLLARVRKVTVDLEPVDMSAVMREVTSRIESLQLEYDATIDFPDSWPAVIGYELWLEEVWVNYISNAVKYGGRPPVVEMGFIDQGPDFVEFWTKDNGNGLEAEELTRLFKPFERLEQSEVGGHGLGLSIVKRIVEKLGGQVGVSSTVGEGCRFSFTLPRHIPS